LAVLLIMATFPALNPNTRTYIPGGAAATAITTLDGDELSVRHTNSSVGHILRLGFVGLTAEAYKQITNHYMLHGRFEPFDLSATTLQSSDLVFPANYLWIYTASPETTYEPGVITVSVELELIPPYTI